MQSFVNSPCNHNLQPIGKHLENLFAIWSMSLSTILLIRHSGNTSSFLNLTSSSRPKLGLSLLAEFLLFLFGISFHPLISPDFFFQKILSNLFSIDCVMPSCVIVIHVFLSTFFLTFPFFLCYHYPGFILENQVFC